MIVFTKDRTAWGTISLFILLGILMGTSTLRTVEISIQQFYDTVSSLQINDDGHHDDDDETVSTYTVEKAYPHLVDFTILDLFFGSSPLTKPQMYLPYFFSSCAGTSIRTTTTFQSIQEC